MADIPNVKLINFVDNPINAHFDQNGFFQVKLAEDSILDVTGYRRVSIFVSQGTCMGPWLSSCEMAMGKLRGATLCFRYNVPFSTPFSDIPTFEVKGPHLVLNLYSEPNSVTKVKLWLYLKS